jgi:hypothetical protein
MISELLTWITGGNLVLMGLIGGAAGAMIYVCIIQLLSQQS